MEAAYNKHTLQITAVLIALVLIVVSLVALRSQIQGYFFSMTTSSDDYGWAYYEQDEAWDATAHLSQSSLHNYAATQEYEAGDGFDMATASNCPCPYCCGTLEM